MAINTQGQTPGLDNPSLPPSEPPMSAAIPAPPPGTINLPPVQVTGNLPINLPPVEVTGTLPPPPPNPFFNPTPANPQQQLDLTLKSLKQKADSHEAVANAIAEGKHQEALAHFGLAQQLDDNLTQSSQEWRDAKAQADAKMKSIDAAIKQGMNMKVDPQNYWNRAGTASNIMSALSVGLGAFASGMTHGATGNPGLTLLNNALEHDMTAQKTNIDNYWKGVQQQYNLADSAFNREIANQNVRATQRTAHIKTAEAVINGLMAQTNSAATKAGLGAQLADLQMLAINAKGQLYATQAAMQAAAQAQSNKDNESFRSEVQAFQKEHPGLSTDDAIREISKTDPARSSRMVSRGAAPAPIMADAVSSHYNDNMDKAIQALEKKTGKKLTDEQKGALKQQSYDAFIKAHPELSPYLQFKDGQLTSIRPEAVAGSTGGPDMRSKEQIKEDKEREVYVDIPVMGSDGKQIIGQDGKPLTKKVTMLAVNKQAADNYVKWSTKEEFIKQNMADLRKAWNEGDVAKYDNIRNTLIETLNPLLGFERAPTEGQIHSTAAEMIPEYVHWYSPGFQSRVNPKLDQLELNINRIGEGFRTNVIGPGAGAGTPVGAYGSQVPVAPPSPSTIPLPPGNPLSVGGVKRTVINGRTYVQDPNTGQVYMEPYQPPSAKPR